MGLVMDFEARSVNQLFEEDAYRQLGSHPSKFIGFFLAYASPRLSFSPGAFIASPLWIWCRFAAVGFDSPLRVAWRFSVRIGERRAPPNCPQMRSNVDRAHEVRFYVRCVFRCPDGTG